MDDLTEVLFDELKTLHGDNLDLSKHHYFLFYQDGLFEVYLDDDRTLKVEVVFLGDSAKIYHTKKRMNDELKIFGTRN